jgi:hypothetical protein
MGTRALSLGVKRLGREADHSSPSPSPKIFYRFCKLYNFLDTLNRILRWTCNVAGMWKTRTEYRIFVGSIIETFSNSGLWY